MEYPYLALLALKTTPKANSKSPAFVLMKRNPRTLLPFIAKTVNKSNTDHKFSNLKELSGLQESVKCQSTTRQFMEKGRCSQ